MENQVTIFTNEEFGDVRTVMVEGKIHFVGKDVAECLGYSNPSKAVITHCKHRIKELMDVSSQNGNAHRARKTQTMILIPEGDVYRLITHSKLPSAEKFESWLFDEVVPQIRKTGGYIPVKEDDDASVIMARALLIAQKTIEEKDKQLKESKKDNMVLKCENAKLKPKADYADEILQSTGTVTTTQIAKDYGMSAKFMNNVLHSLGIQYKVNDQWVLYSKYADKGYVESCTHVINHTDGTPESKVYSRWTQKGRMFIYEKLKEEGILPVKYKNESDC